MNDPNQLTPGEGSRDNLPPVPVHVVLRNEIIESEKAGADFLKWKLIVTATVASVSVGFWKQPQGGADAKLIICLIPLICAYVDMVNLDLAVRIIVIAGFLRQSGDPYELYVQSLRSRDDNSFRFAPIAIHASSLIVSLLIVGIGLYGASHAWAPFEIDAFLISGVLGTLIAAVLWIVYSLRIRYLARQTSDVTITRT